VGGVGFVILRPPEPKTRGARPAEDAEGSPASQAALNPYGFQPALRILNYYIRKTSSGAAILSGFAEKLGDVGISSGEDGCGKGLSKIGETIACCFLDLLDESMSAKDA